MKRIILNRLKIMWKIQQGTSMVFVAGILIIICGISAVVVDVGTVYVKKGNLQKTLDASVLAGASELMAGDSKAVSTAISIADKNKLTLTASDIKTGSDYIAIKKTVNASLTFARMFGIDSIAVPAFAKAKVRGGFLGTEGIVPIAIPSYKLPDPTDPYPEFPMNFQPGNGNNEENSSVKGNFGFLAIGGTGGSVLRSNIINGVDLEVSDEMYEYTKTGLSWGNVKIGFEERIQEDGLNRPYCSNYETADSTCSRVVIVPIVDSFTDVSGKTMVKIIGFASVWISKITGHTVQAQYIETITFGEFGDPGDANNYHVLGVSLVE
ncbi:MAG: hypothetical protein K6T88_00895 [Bacillus sp. (in: Bacteria)]|nr:hypothetical protein [Bacillus sp. (in: firmicutes)]